MFDQVIHSHTIELHRIWENSRWFPLSQPSRVLRSPITHICNVYRWYAFASGFRLLCFLAIAGVVANIANCLHRPPLCSQPPRPHRSLNRAPEMSKKFQNAQLAAAKARNQRVYISGLEGHHSLETGVAYYYRGHYIYAYPGSNPIEPVPFSTAKGIKIAGTRPELAPRHDPNARDLVAESSISALNKSCDSFYRARKEEEDEEKREVAQALELQKQDAAEEEDIAAAVEMPIIVRSSPHTLRSLLAEASTSYTTPLVPSQVLSRGGSRGNSHISLPSLTVLDARPPSADPALSGDSVIRSSQSHDNLDAMFGAGRHHGQHLLPRPASAVNFTLRRSSQPDSSTSLTHLTAHDSQADYGLSSTSRLPGLRQSSSAGYHASSASLNTLVHEVSGSSLQVPNSLTIPSVPPYLTLETIYHPHDRARFLSDSAPGSRLVSTVTTPHASRPVSPNPHQRISSLRQVSSTTRLAQLLNDHHTSPSRLSDVAEGTSHLTTSLHSAGNIRAETNRSPEPLPSPSTYHPHKSNTALPTMSSPPTSRNKPIGTGRPRRASLLLNNAYNAANPAPVQATKCALHGEDCDGVYVAETWRTQRARETVGMREVVPMVRGEGGREMVDWMGLVGEARRWM